jgi:hypothetical protein
MRMDIIHSTKGLRRKKTEEGEFSLSDHQSCNMDLLQP